MFNLSGTVYPIMTIFQWLIALLFNLVIFHNLCLKMSNKILLVVRCFMFITIIKPNLTLSFITVNDDNLTYTLAWIVEKFLVYTIKNIFISSIRVYYNFEIDYKPHQTHPTQIVKNN